MEKDVSAPVHGGDVWGLFREGADRRILDFSASISPLGLPEAARAALADCGDLCVHYPDPHCRELVEELAGVEAVPPEWILPGSGASDLILRIVRAVAPKEALLTAPTFSEYEAALRTLGDCHIRHLPLSPEREFRLGEEILEEIPQNGILFLCNPNNPTGQLVEPKLLESVLRVCERRETLLVVDECFLGFLEEESRHTGKRLLGESGNLLILRALTKLYAMPGLRLGYLLCSHRGLLERIEAMGAPWSVSVPAQLCGAAALRDDAYPRRVRALIGRERPPLEQGLRDCGFRVFPSAGNYILFRAGREDLAQRLRERGILIRDCRNFPQLGPAYYRVAVRTREENNALLGAIKETI